jgi:hypothetical protein
MSTIDSPSLVPYYVNEAAFALPRAPFVDRTLHRLTAALPNADDPLTLEIRRVPMAPEASLRRLVDDAISSEKAKERGFTVVELVESVLDGTAALLLRARLRARDTIYVQLQAHVAVDGNWLSFVVTGPGTHRKECEETFDRMIRGLRWRRR